MMEFIRMSLSASALILAATVLRALTLHRLPKRTFLALWAAALCRLLVPVSIPSRLSIYMLVGRLGTGGPEQEAAGAAALQTGTGAVSAALTQADPARLSPLLAVWLAGVSGCALFFLVTHLRCRREYKTALPVVGGFAGDWQREHPIRRKVAIRQSDRIAAPLTYGILRPVVLFPKRTDWADETRLRYVLTHEFTHIRRFDTLAKLLLAAALCIHWFNPLVWLMYVLANRDIELSCDEAVVRMFGETSKSAYAAMLIGMEESKNGLTPLCSNFSKNAIEERIVSIMKLKKASLKGISLAVVLVLGTVTVFATSAYAKEAAPDPQKTASSMAADLKIDRKAISYDEFKSWLEIKTASIQEKVRSGEWSQETADRELEGYEQILNRIKDGAEVSITADSSGKETITIVPASSFNVSESVRNGAHYVTISD